MTRQEFIEDVNSFGELLSICTDYGIDICDDIYDADYFGSYVLEIVHEMRDWEQIRDFLKEIPSNTSYYREDGYGGFEDAEEYFDNYKNDVLREMDATNSWDEEDDDYTEDGDNGDINADVEEIEINSFMAVLGRAG